MATNYKSSFEIASESAPSTWSDPFIAKAINLSLESLASSDSGRNDNGSMVITYIKPCLRKWEIEMPPLTPTQVYNLFNLVQGKKYWIKTWDISSNSAQAVKVYTSSSKAECYSGVLNGDGLYQGVSFSAIELG